MTETAVARDLEAAEKALVQKYGNFVLFNARTKPVEVVDTVFAAWGVDPLVPFAHPDHVPNFSQIHGPKGIVAEVDRFYGVLPAPFDQDAVPELPEDLSELPVVDVEAVVQSFQDELAVAAETGVSSPAVDRLVADVTAKPNYDYEGLTLVQLRKGSRGHVSGGYSLKRPELEKALKKAKVTRDAVLANQA